MCYVYLNTLKPRKKKGEVESLVYHNVKLKSTYELIKLFYQDSFKKL